MKLLPLLILALSLGCVSFDVYKQGPENEPQKVGEAFVFGQGCAVVSHNTDGTFDVLLQHSGMSQILGGTIRSLVSVAGEVFGTNPREDDSLAARGGCEGALTGNDPANGEDNTSDAPPPG